MDEHEFVLNFGALLPGYEVTGFRRLHGYRIAKSSTYLAISSRLWPSDDDGDGGDVGTLHNSPQRYLPEGFFLPAKMVR